jgi:regulator of sirC expression with transglutaminase-like and TPR domain
MAWLNALDSNTDDLKALLKEKRDLLNLLRTLVSENLYICGHGSPYDPNIILTIQVSARARALLGLNLLEQHCLRLAAIYQELGNYTEHERTIYNLCHNAVTTLKAINPNYDASEILNILNELIQVQIAKSHLIGFSHDVNEFFIIAVNEDGTLEYIFF